jgi:hypothetical protein
MSKRKKEKNSKHVEVGAKYSVLADSYKDKKPEKKNDSARKDEEKEKQQ